MLSSPVDAFKREVAPFLIARQADSSNTDTTSQSPPQVKESATSQTGNSESGSRTTASASSSATDDNNSSNSDTAKETGTAKSSGSQSGSATGSQSGSKTTGGSSSSKSGSQTQFDPRLPAGGASMITPNAMSQASYYKIKDQITFAWNYTSLSSNPKHVEVLATCNANNALYTIAANETWEQQQTIIWDTGKYQATGTIPLLTETYTLIIHDAQKDISATASPGYLGTWKQFTFGMYEPMPYTPIADYVCATCSSAMSQMEKQTYGFLVTMVGVTVLTFGWFTGAAGLW
jgi:hypothetical protein